MNNTLSTQIQNLVNKLPVTIFFEQIPDRKQALKYVQWLYDNAPESKTISQDKLFREVISKELRLVSMKIIEIEILLMVGLETITLNDFSIDSKTLVGKLISENPDNYDLDIMYRIMAQIMTKLPKDLKERVTGKHKLQIFQKLSQSIKIDNKLLEQFASVDPTLSLNTPVSMELDKGDYNTLNKKYLYELQNYEASKGYISAESMEYANYAKENITNNNTNNNDLKAQYVDNSPDFMLGQNDNTLYYFDSSSGTLTEMPLDSKQTPVSLKDLKTVLLSDKVKLGDIQNLITDLQIPPPALPTILSSDPTMTTQPATFFDTIGSFFTSGSRFQATGTSTPTAAPIPIATTDIPIPPQYMVNLFKDDKELGEYWRRGHHGHRGRHRRQENNLERRFEAREKLYEPVDDPIDKKHSSGSTKSFMNRTNANDIYPNKKRAEGFTNMNEEIFLKKIKNDNQQIENVALSFVTILILVFLLVIFNSLRK